MISCVICGGSTSAHLVGRPDYEYGIEEKLQYRRCTQCGLVFSSAIPVSSISSFYERYSTHHESNDSLLARRARTQTLVETLDAIGDARNLAILDYGCGNGTFLAQLKDVGFVDLTGYDFDAKAREAAKASGAHVVDSVNGLVGAFDVVTLNHVIEHLVDPVRQLAEISDLLKPRGKLVMRTPNAASLLARLTGDRWRGWETPRHLHVFTPKSIKLLIGKVSGLEIERCYTSNAMFLGIFHESLRAFRWKLIRHCAAFVTAAAVRVTRGRNLEEELVVIAKRTEPARNWAAKEGEPDGAVT